MEKLGSGTDGDDRQSITVEREQNIRSRYSVYQVFSISPISAFWENALLYAQSGRGGNLGLRKGPKLRSLPVKSQLIVIFRDIGAIASLATSLRARARSGR